MNTPSKLLSSFHIAAFSYYDGALAFKALKVGAKLKISAEPTIKDKYM